MLLLTSVMVSCTGSPGAVVVELPKLLRMSLRTTPLAVRMLLTEPFTEFEPSEGYGPLVSAGSAMQAVVLLEEEELALLEEEPLELEELLDDELLVEELDELLEELLEPFEEPLLPPDPPPQEARKAAAPPPASQPIICRR